MSLFSVEPPTAAPPTHGALVVMAAALGLSVGFVGLYFGTLSVFLKPMAAAFGWGRAEAGSLSSAAMLGFAVGAPVLGATIDLLGPRRLIGASIPLFALAILVESVLPPIYFAFAATCFVIGLLGVGTGPAGYLSILPRLFDQRLGLALGFAMAGSGLGGAVMPIVAQRLLAGHDWRLAYAVLAGLALLVGTAAWCFVPANRPVAGQREASAALAGASRREAFADRRFWTLAAVIFVATAGGLGATVHVVALLTDRGMAPPLAASIAAFTGLGLLIGRFTGGLILDRVFAPLIAAGALVLGLIGLLGIAFDTDGGYAAMATCAALFGVALGTEGDFAAFAVRRYFGMRAFGAIYGVIMSAYALGGIVGPVVFGIAFDRLGSYQVILAIAAAGYVLAAGGVMTLGRYRWP